MKQTLLILFIEFSFQFTKAQHYTQNIAFDTTLNGGHYLVNTCTQTIQTRIELDASLFNYVSGMKFIVIFDTVHSMGPSQVHSGDTLVLNSTNPVISLISGSGTDYWYRVKLVGTPTLAGQTYPCAIEFDQCTCFCFNAIIKASTTNTSTCSVDISNSITETKNNLALHIFPNPVIDYLNINNLTNHSTIQLYDIFGKLVFEEEIDANTKLKTSDLKEGVYTLFVTDDYKHKTYTKVIVTK